MPDLVDRLPAKRDLRTGVRRMRARAKLKVTARIGQSARALAIGNNPYRLFRRHGQANGDRSCRFASLGGSPPFSFSLVGTIEGDGPSNWRSRSTRFLRFGGSSGSSPRYPRSRPPISRQIALAWV